MGEAEVLKRAANGDTGDWQLALGKAIVSWEVL